MSSELKNCQFCGEKILFIAKKCKYCKSDLTLSDNEEDKGLKKRQEKKVIINGFSDESITKKIIQARKKWKDEGWSVIEEVDGGLAKSSYLLLEKYKTEEEIKNCKKKQGSRGCLIFVVVFIIIILIAYVMDSGRNSELENTTDPARIAFLLLDYVDEGAMSTTRFNGKVITVNYRIDPWSLTSASAKRQFLRQTKELVPTYFERFPVVTSIHITATAMFVDARGNQSRDKAMSIKFSRENSKNIQWDNIYTENIPSLADSFWIHPSFNN